MTPAFRSKHSLPDLLISGLIVILFGVAILFGGWTSLPKTFSQFRNPIIFILTAAVILRFFYQDLFLKIKAGHDPQRIRQILFAVYFIAFLKVTCLDYFSFSINGFDASVYDYAVMNTLRGRFMESINGVNHFGIHATPVLFLFVPLHFIFHSPFFFNFLYPIVLFLGAFLFDQCMRIRSIDAWSRLGFLFAYLNSVWLSRTLHYGFHVEAFYPIAVFLLDLSINRSRPFNSKILFWLIAALFLSIKEDAPFYLIALAAAYTVIGKMSFRRLLGVAAFSALVFIFYIKIIIPQNSPSGQYLLVGSVSDAGSTLSDMVSTFLKNPIHVLRRFFTGEWWQVFLPSLGLLLASPFFWIAGAPALALYSLAGGSQMFSLMLYYGIPLLAPLALGLLEGHARIPSRWKTASAALAIIGISTIGSGYFVFRKTDISEWKKTHELLESIPESASICAPASLFPQLPYGELQLLDSKCLKRADFVLLPTQSSDLSRYGLNGDEETRIRKELKNWDFIPSRSTLVDGYRKRRNTN
jgi:uncharacterized membrane protein